MSHHTGRQAARRTRAFTLVELLVVLGIIAVLLAILLPVISRARRAAQSVACLSNLRQLATAFNLYVNDNRNGSIPFAFDVNHSWIVAFRAETAVPDKVYRCPTVGDEVGPDFGSANQSWKLTLKSSPDGKATDFTGSYGFNGWLLRWESTGRGGDQFSGGDQTWYAKVSSRGAGGIPVLADATWMDGWPREVDPTPPDVITGDRGQQGPNLAPNENMMARFTIARHGAGINISFVDGHAETTLLDRLKRLQWHQRFVYQDWAPPLPRQ